MLQISLVAHHGVTASCAETSCLSIQEPPLVSTVGQQHWSATLVSNVGHRWSRTVDETGVNTVPITTTGNEKTHFTVVLACSETGKKLKPLVIFKRKTLPKENKTTTAVIPGGLTKVLQPLDISVNCSFKAKIREQWEKWRESTPIQRQEK